MKGTKTKTLFDESIKEIEEEYFDILPKMVNEFSPLELTLLKYFYPSRTKFEMALIHIEFIAKPIEDMKTRLQLLMYS